MFLTPFVILTRWFEVQNHFNWEYCFSVFLLIFKKKTKFTKAFPKQFFFDTDSEDDFESLTQVDINGERVLVWFYGISTLVGYLMPNPLYKYIRYI